MPVNTVGNELHIALFPSLIRLRGFGTLKTIWRMQKRAAQIEPPIYRHDGISLLKGIGCGASQLTTTVALSSSAHG